MHQHAHPAEDEQNLHVVKGGAAPKPHSEREDNESDPSDVVPIPLPELHANRLLQLLRTEFWRIDISLWFVQ